MPCINIVSINHTSKTLRYLVLVLIFQHGANNIVVISYNKTGCCCMCVLHFTHTMLILFYTTAILVLHLLVLCIHILLHWLHLCASPVNLLFTKCLHISICIYYYLYTSECVLLYNLFISCSFITVYMFTCIPVYNLSSSFNTAQSVYITVYTFYYYAG